MAVPGKIGEGWISEINLSLPLFFRLYPSRHRQSWVPRTTGNLGTALEGEVEERPVTQNMCLEWGVCSGGTGIYPLFWSHPGWCRW
jgi:hypothetical protein